MGYHPQCNEQTERANQQPEVTIRLCSHSKPNLWSAHLTWIEDAYNYLNSSATGFSPFEICLSYHPPLLPSQEPEIAAPSVHEQSGATSDCSTEPAPRGLEKDPNSSLHHWPTGLVNMSIPLKGMSKKPPPHFLDPFIIQHIINPVTVWLRLPSSMRVHTMRGVLLGLGTACVLVALSFPFFKSRRPGLPRDSPTHL